MNRTPNRTPSGTPRLVQGVVEMAALSLDGSGASVPVSVRVCWSSADPWLVALWFGPDDTATCWQVALELLVDGCGAPAGLGDASLLPDPGTDGTNGTDGADGEYGAQVAELVLSTPVAKACLRFDVDDLAAVLDEITLGGATDVDANGEAELVAAAALPGWRDGLDDEITAFLADPRRQNGQPLEIGDAGGHR